MYIMWPWPLLYQGVNLSISSLNCFNNIKIKDISHMFANCLTSQINDWVKVINIYYFSINETDILLLASLSLCCLAGLLIFLLIFFLQLIDSLFKQKLEDDKKPLFIHIRRLGEGQYDVNVNLKIIFFNEGERSKVYWTLCYEMVFPRDFLVLIKHCNHLIKFTISFSLSCLVLNVAIY